MKERSATSRPLRLSRDRGRVVARFPQRRSTPLIALAPLVMGVVLSLGILGLFGMPLNPANMIAFPLILGVGVDNGVHVLHDYLLRQARRALDDQLRHRSRRAGEGADDDDRFRHVDDFQRARPGGAGLNSDARRRLFDADGVGFSAGGAAPDGRTQGGASAGGRGRIAAGGVGKSARGVAAPKPQSAERLISVRSAKRASAISVRGLLVVVGWAGRCFGELP